MPEKSRIDEAGELALGVAGCGDLRWAVADVGGPLEAIRRTLDLSPIAAVALGRALAAAVLLLRFTTKEPGRLVLEVLGDGPLGNVIAEADGHGRLRGLVGEPRLPTPPGGGLEIGWAVGKGTLKVTQEGKRGRYSSRVQLVSGELGKDLVHFLDQSQQIRSAALLGVQAQPSGVGAAGGLLVEAFPGVAGDTLERLEANIAAAPGAGAALSEGGPGHLRDAVLAGFDREDLERHPLLYSCRCRRDQLLSQIQGMAGGDLEAMTDERGRITAVCAFCETAYDFAREELRVH